MWKIAMIVSVLVLTISIYLSLGSLSGEHMMIEDLIDETSTIFPWNQPMFFLNQKVQIDGAFNLEYDFYQISCSDAEKTIDTMMDEFYKNQSDIAPALLRLVFHDCFIHGCDASVLLDSPNPGNQSEKDVIPNLTLRGFDIIDHIKARMEVMCPGTVSCADILVLAARRGVVLAGGPFYPLATGRRDSNQSFPQDAATEIPSPNSNLSRIIRLFSDRGFDVTETVTLLGGHNIGKIHCQFILNRLHNHSGTGLPDPDLDIGTLNMMRAICGNSTDQTQEPSISMDSVGAPEFGTHYYRNLQQGKAILRSDQELMTADETKRLVDIFASDGSLFQMNFGSAMMKLSNLQVLTGQQGQIRTSCSRVNA